MAFKLVPELLCIRCLRYFSHWEHLEKSINIKLSTPNLRHHQKYCRLHFKNLVFDSSNLKIYCVGPDTPQKERDQCGHIAKTMWSSEEVPGDKIGWYAKKKLNDDLGYAFIPVFKENVAGIAIVHKRKTFCYSLSRKEFISGDKDSTPRWCADKIWIYEPYRRMGISSRIIHSIALYFHEDVSNLGFLTPFTDAGKALALSLIKDTILLAASTK
ncbi:MAG TPA: hypothetical protein VLX68_01150 [Chitinivibrionales bacterium]|nr:hypothetical protein [Chitinivibrionales bacterium]